jgi:ATP-dependent DNA ligase
MWGLRLRLRGVVLLTPVLALQVVCHGFLSTEEFTAGVRLRFPRVRSVRFESKPWHECLTLSRE